MKNIHTQYLLIGVMDYHLHENHADDDLNLALVQFNVRDAIAIRDFHEDWDQLTRRHSPFYHSLTETRLVSTSIVENLKQEAFASPLKLDSITHLKEPLQLQHESLPEAIGYLVMNRETFFFQFEIPLLNRVSEHIYRSAEFGYLKLQTTIDNLLKQLDE